MVKFGPQLPSAWGCSRGGYVLARGTWALPSLSPPLNNRWRYDNASRASGVGARIACLRHDGQTAGTQPLGSRAPLARRLHTPPLHPDPHVKLWSLLPFLPTTTRKSTSPWSCGWQCEKVSWRCASHPTTSHCTRILGLVLLGSPVRSAHGPCHVRHWPQCSGLIWRNNSDRSYFGAVGSGNSDIRTFFRISGQILEETPLGNPDSVRILPK